jgi:cytochrome c oxidase cbb3-type subunit 3
MSILALALAALSATASAQPPARRAESPAASPVPETAARETFAPELVEAGSSVFAAQCGFCHGRDAAGAAGGSDLTRSELVAEDVAGDRIAPVVRNGRPGTTMPAFPALSAADLTAVVAFVHDRQARAASVEGGRRSVGVADLQTGDAETGRRYFEAECNRCHSADGDLAGIAGRIQGLPLLQRLLYPRPGGFGGTPARAQSRVMVTTADGETISGPLAYRDEFTLALTDPDGRYRSFATNRVDFEVENPLDGHRELLGRYTDESMHDVLAYLHTLR